MQFIVYIYIIKNVSPHVLWSTFWKNYKSLAVSKRESRVVSVLHKFTFTEFVYYLCLN